MGAERYLLLVLAAVVHIDTAICIPGDPVVYFPPFELRAVQADETPFMPIRNGNLANTFPQQMQSHFHRGPEEAAHIASNSFGMSHHKAPIQSPVQNIEEHPDSRNSTVSVHDLLEALGITDEDHNKQEVQGRAAAGKDYEYPPYSPYSRPPPEYGYPPRGYWPPPPPPPPPPSYQSPYAYVPPMYGLHPQPPPKEALSLLKKLPEALPGIKGLVKPVATKVADKVSGLIGLVLALLTGSSSDGLELKGLKDVVINGIVKPLMVAKGGIKSLISKLAIPVIVLLLINVEVLVLIWWLWEDCSPEPVHTAPVYPYHYSKPSYSTYNPY